MGLWAALILAVVLLGLGVPQLLVHNATQTTTLLVSSMTCHSFEPLLAEAQSVPSASADMCLRSLPVGWSLSRVQAQRGRSVITLDNDRGGVGSLLLTLTARCDVGQAVPVRSPGPGIARFRAPGRSLVVIGAVYLASAALAAAAPTPGGLGAIESALIAGLTGVGMQAGPAVSAVLLYRLTTYWLPILPGWLSWRFLQRREYL